MLSSVRDDIALSYKSEVEVSTGVAKAFWEWSEKQVELYL